MGNLTPQPFYSQGKTAPHHTHWTGSWVGVRISLYAVEKRKMLCCCQESTPILLLLGLQHSHYTECAAPVSIQSKNQVKNKKIKNASSPTCNCPEQVAQMARHLMTECSLFSRNRPAVLHNLPPHMILKHHTHTVSVSNFLSSIIHSLTD